MLAVYYPGMALGDTLTDMANELRGLREKLAFVPAGAPAPAPQQGAPVGAPAAMAAGGGAPPMDPAAMAAGGGAPPMDPAAMGGAIPGAAPQGAPPAGDMASQIVPILDQVVTRLGEQAQATSDLKTGMETMRADLAETRARSEFVEKVVQKFAPELLAPPQPPPMPVAAAAPAPAA